MTVQRFAIDRKNLAALGFSPPNIETFAQLANFARTQTQATQALADAAAAAAGLAALQTDVAELETDVAELPLWIPPQQPIDAQSLELASADIGDLAETIRDTMAAALTAGANVIITPNDGADTITISATGGAGSGVSRLYSSAAANGTPANNTETTLHTYTLPGGTLSADGMGVRVTMGGTYAANTRAKTVTAYFGAFASPTFSVNGSTVVQWRSEFVILRAGATSQRGAAFSAAGIAGSNEDALSRSRNFSPSETLSSDIVIKVTGTVAGAAVANDIVCNLFLVELIP